MEVHSRAEGKSPDGHYSPKESWDIVATCNSANDPSKMVIELGKVNGVIEPVADGQ